MIEYFLLPIMIGLVWVGIAALSAVITFLAPTKVQRILEFKLW